MTALTIGARSWDHLIPLALGDVAGSTTTTLERHDLTPNIWSEAHLDGSETSLSSYVRARATGDDSVTALPVFIMRGFRHRCIITRKDSPLETAADLAGARIGLTGWPDSGNTWTRAILRREGVGIADAEWRVGALTAAHPIQDRMGGVAAPATVAATENDEPMVEMLLRGALNAVMTPFAPPGFYDVNSPFRTLYRDNQSAERDYFASTGYIPGIHVLAVKTAVLDADPGAAQRLVDVFAASQTLSYQRRAKMLDVTPWQNDAFESATAAFGEDFSPIGWNANATMIADFQTELVEQGLMNAPLPASDLFPYAVEVSDAARA
jgi:4,5-dihydroxyphthalate decarboxylase